MPTPTANEDRDEFVDRCMSDPEARRDFPDADQRLAFCESQYDRNKAKGESMETKSLPFECKVDADKRLVEGYAATFDRDQVDDVIEPGAFRKTIRERGDRVKFLWQHSEIIGKAEHLEEDSRGLYARASVSRTTLGSDALALMEDGAVDQLSIGFAIPQGKAEINRETGVRRIQEIKLFEFSAVSFPANSEAMITSVKALYDQAQRYGTDAFGDRADEVRAALHNLEALIAKGEPPNGTPGVDQPPSDSEDDPQLRQALQSLHDEAAAWVAASTRLQV